MLICYPESVTSCVWWCNSEMMLHNLFSGLYVLIISRTRCRVNPHSVVSWMSRNSLLEGGVKTFSGLFLTGIKLQWNLSTGDTIGTSKWCLLQRGVHYIEVLPKLACFSSKTYSRVLGYSVIETKVCQKFGVGRRKPKDNILEDIMLIW